MTTEWHSWVHPIGMSLYTSNLFNCSLARSYSLSVVLPGSRMSCRSQEPRIPEGWSYWYRLKWRRDLQLLHVVCDMVPHLIQQWLYIFSNFPFAADMYLQKPFLHVSSPVQLCVGFGSSNPIPACSGSICISSGLAYTACISLPALILCLSLGCSSLFILYFLEREEPPFSTPFLSHSLLSFSPFCLWGVKVWVVPLLSLHKKTALEFHELVICHHINYAVWEVAAVWLPLKWDSFRAFRDGRITKISLLKLQTGHCGYIYF